VSRIATTATPDVLRLRGRRRVLLCMSWGLGQFSGCLFVLSRRLHLSLGPVGEYDVDSYIVSSCLCGYGDQGLSKIQSFGLERKGVKGSGIGCCNPLPAHTYLSIQKTIQGFKGLEQSQYYDITDSQKCRQHHRRFTSCGIISPPCITSPFLIRTTCCTRATKMEISPLPT
jgi:hypothetical protein